MHEFGEVGTAARFCGRLNTTAAAASTGAQTVLPPPPFCARRRARARRLTATRLLRQLAVLAAAELPRHAERRVELVHITQRSKRLVLWGVGSDTGLFICWRVLRLVRVGL